MPKASKTKVVDGRRLRTEHSRRSIIEAGIALVEEGNLFPSIVEIAERAGVGRRSFFRHFEDMEAFFVELDDQIRDFYESRFVGGDRDGSLEQRIEHVVELHAEAYDRLSSIMLASRTMQWRYETVGKNYRRGQRGLRKDLRIWLPELNDIPKEDSDAVDAIASFDMWYRLRSEQLLSRAASIAIVTKLIKGLISIE